MVGSFVRSPLLLGIAAIVASLACSPASSSTGQPDAAAIEGRDASIIGTAPPTDTSAAVKDSQPTLCGNGAEDPGELCDDGNAQYGDGCSHCQVEPGWTCPVFGQPCLSMYACGNGLLSPGEACDDGNSVGGDGCSADCKRIEPGWRCRVPGKPCMQACTPDAGGCADQQTTAVCGNGVVEPGEECDEGNDDGNDTSKTPHNGDGRYGGCTSACTWGTYCGDGVVNGPEACDDGLANGDLYGKPGCTFACTKAGYCGDGIVDIDLGDEECDLGAQNGDPCTTAAACTKECTLPLGIQCRRNRRRPKRARLFDLPRGT
jgi:cysteine-rich repeat protein